MALHRFLLLVLLLPLGCAGVPAHAQPSQPPPTVLLDVKGTENMQTPYFYPSGPWTVRWKAAQTDANADADCIFSVRIYSDPKAVSYHVVGIDIQGWNSDVDYQQSGGSYFLDVQASGCQWEVVVKGQTTHLT